MTIVVCPAASLPAICEKRAPSHLLLLSSPGRESPAPPPASHSLALAFNDIAEERPGLVAPDGAAIQAILAFGRSWTGDAPLLVSCELGISRSPAAAFILACQARPEEPERNIAERLRRAAPCATPNGLIVGLADDALGRAGRMVEAIRAIGRGAEYVSQEGFELRTDSAHLLPLREKVAFASAKVG